VSGWKWKGGREMDNRVGKALFPAPSLSIMKHAQWNAYGKDKHKTINKSNGQSCLINQKINI